ncbi:cytochrome b562 [Engelhardtia mirabilis]|uniref:Cytochrome b562 n=1 Tax=Engelhardtia mirabilis TaxID=2528011 RepID=A0A518BJJ5_9BACT|nr:Cytochrome b562 [Planctomycetes bacterium Pla133]QDV01452.1 Cytochrome b562 [Planctomycetes bacterium Pla86]
MLRRPVLMLAAIAAPLLLPIVQNSGTLQQERGTQEHSEEHEEEGPLEQAMSRLKGGTRALRAMMARQDAAGCLSIVSDMQAAVIQAKGEIPETAEAKSEEERPAFVTDYRRTMLTLLTNLIDLERSFLDGDFEAAQAIYDERVRPMEREGHDKFKGGGGERGERSPRGERGEGGR